MCCYKTHAAQGNELVTDDVELNCCVLEDEPYLQARLPAAAKSGNKPAPRSSPNSSIREKT